MTEELRSRSSSLFSSPLKKAGSIDILGSKGNIFKDLKSKNKQNAVLYKQRKKAEGEESEKEPVQ